ncbi:MAG TPA: hypothetical protein VH917_03910 [Ignavibacteriaceae bacterium]|jgi:hypothetical protein
MKYFISLFVTSLLFIYSCDSNVDPQYKEPTNKITEGNTNAGGSVSSIINYDIIPLPERSPIYLDSVFSVTKSIIGEIGGHIALDRTYISNRGRLVTMLVNLTIPPNAFSGQRNITLTIDRDYAAVHCLPGMQFNLPLNLVQTFTGLDIQDYETEDIDFVYIRKNGTLEEVDRTAIVVNKLLGIVTVLDAKLNHFSRYGWVRKNQ